VLAGSKALNLQITGSPDQRSPDYPRFFSATPLVENHHLILRDEKTATKYKPLRVPANGNSLAYIPGKVKSVRERLAMKKAILAVLFLAVISLVISVQAQEYDRAPSAPPAQPEAGVAHISLIHGDVSMQRGDTGDWTATTLNTPLVRGDQVATGEKSRTEVQLDYANVLRLSSRSQMKIADLTRTRIQIQIAQGYANFSSFKGSEADVELDTPNVAVRPLKHGRYRVQVNSDSETM
jgi:hypothetical protein